MALEPISLFKDLAIADAFQENGYVKIPFTSDLQLLRLKQLFKNYFGEEDVFKNFFYSIQALTPDQCLVLKNAISQILEPSLNNTFVNYKTIADSFLAKPKNLESMWLHQDWSYAFEQDTFCATLWLPLINTHTSNGTLFYIKQSHRFFQNYRSGNYPTSRIEMNDLLEQHVSTINVKAGEAVFFHPALFHGSYPNSTNELRIVSAAIVLPRECNAMYFHKLSSQTAEVFEFSDLAFFENLKQLAIGLRPNGKEVNKLRYEHNEINAESLLQKIREHNAF